MGFVSEPRYPWLLFFELVSVVHSEISDHKLLSREAAVLLQVDAGIEGRQHPRSEMNRVNSWDALFNGSQSPNVLDVMAHLPVEKALKEGASQNVIDDDRSVAVCAAGHLRTFVLPGVYSSLAENVLKTAPGGNADLFLEGHLGNFKGGENSQETLDFQSPEQRSDKRLQEALKYLAPSLVHTEVDDGECAALQAAWAADGISGRTCREADGNFMQIMWLDHCIRQTRKSGKKFDLIVRARPDVAVFKAIPWSDVSWDRVTYMQKDAGGRADWFFTIPQGFIDTWWESIVQYYNTGTGLPDYTIFNRDQSILKEISFPAAIVRGPSDAQCFRILDKENLKACEDKANSGFSQLER